MYHNVFNFILSCPKHKFFTGFGRGRMTLLLLLLLLPASLCTFHRDLDHIGEQRYHPQVD